VIYFVVTCKHTACVRVYHGLCDSNKLLCKGAFSTARVNARHSPYGALTRVEDLKCIRSSRMR